MDVNKLSQIAKQLTAEKYTIMALPRLYFVEHRSGACYEYYSHIKLILFAQVLLSANSHK